MLFGGSAVTEARCVVWINAVSPIDRLCKDEIADSLDDTILKSRGVVLTRSVVQSSPNMTDELSSTEEAVDMVNAFVVIYRLMNSESNFHK